MREFKKDGYYIFVNQNIKLILTVNQKLQTVGMAYVEYKLIFKTMWIFLNKQKAGKDEDL